MTIIRGNRGGWIAALVIALAAGAILFAMGRPPICTCGTVEIWHGAIDSGNSQHISDWYSLSHIIHGFLFFGLAWLAMRRWPVGIRLASAVLVESAWEILENSPIIIDRYRTATMALGYSGDSIVNSMSDIAMMSLGFMFASRVPWWVTALVGVAFEVLALTVIRDNLTLNILMLTWPVEAVKVWQGGA